MRSEELASVIEEHVDAHREVAADREGSIRRVEEIEPVAEVELEPISEFEDAILRKYLAAVEARKTSQEP